MNNPDNILNTKGNKKDLQSNNAINTNIIYRIPA